ncbi:ATP-binding protein [Streptomyces sp. B21-083]|uniref:ATP-binding protein n=1 Tax=Streptomyces sp. B21-083 TaxID=3039410 RepID=UPI003FA7A91C
MSGTSGVRGDNVRVPPPVLAAGDEARPRRMVANLLADARVHPPSGTTAAACVEVVDYRCVIRVRDDGPGIPPHLFPSVFERFTRADASRARSGSQDGGSGLGLAIVSAVIAPHRGRIDVDIAPGHTEFTIEPPTGRPPRARSRRPRADPISARLFGGERDRTPGTPVICVRPLCVRRLQLHPAALASLESEVGALPYRADRNP